MSTQSEADGGMFGPVIFSYTRAQAIEDGVLVEIDPLVAREAGFLLPVAVTETVWHRYIEWPDGHKPRACQDQAGRLWDVLWMGSLAARRSSNRNTNLCRYELRVVPCDGNGVRAKVVILKLHVGPGDNMEPVITIMLPDED